MINNGKTLEAFLSLQETVSILRYIYENNDMGDEFLRARYVLDDDIKNFVNSGQVSLEVAKKYEQFQQDFENNPGEAIDTFLRYINVRTDDVEDADKKLNVALDWSGNAAEYVDKQNDSKHTLDLLNNLISQYDKEYNELGELESVDALCRVGNEIRTALGENKLSRKTADDLMKPLQEIQDNMFDEKLHADKIREFMGVLDDAMSRQDEKSPIEKPKGKDGQKIDGAEMNAPEYAGGGGVLGNAIHDTAILGRNIGRTVQNVVRGIKEADKKIEEKAKAKADEYEEKLQREMGAADIVQSAADDKRKLEPELQQQTNEKAIAELQRIGKMFDRQHSDESLKKMMLSLKESVKQGVIPREYFDTYKGIVDDYKQNRNADNSLLRLDNEINLQIAEMQNGDKGIKEHPQQAKNKEREMTSKDVVQSAADDKRRLKEDVKTQDTKADKQGVKKHTMKSLHDTINNYKKGIAQGSVDDVRKEFVNISHEIESAVQQSVISEKLANDLIKHMRDVAGLKGDKDFIPQSPEYMGFGKRKGKDNNAQIRAQEDKELAPDRADISSKFKDGIVNVLNIQREEKRTEQRAANETKEKDSLEQRRIMSLRKFFKKEQDQ